MNKPFVILNKKSKKYLRIDMAGVYITEVATVEESTILPTGTDEGDVVDDILNGTWLDEEALPITAQDLIALPVKIVATLA